jgi:general secretion pathway protein G
MKLKAFTLIELLVVIAIISLLASVVLVAINSARINARNARRKADVLQFRKALEAYYQDNSDYPEGGLNPNNDSTDMQNTTLAADLVPKYISGIPVDPKASPKNYRYVHSGDDQDYGLFVPFSNDGGTDCKFITANGNDNWFKVGPTRVANCS